MLKILRVNRNEFLFFFFFFLDRTLSLQGNKPYKGYKPYKSYKPSEGLIIQLIVRTGPRWSYNDLANILRNVFITLSSSRYLRSSLFELKTVKFVNERENKNWLLCDIVRVNIFFIEVLILYLWSYNFCLHFLPATFIDIYL